MKVDTFIVNVEVAVVREGRYLAIVRGAGVTYGSGWLVIPGGKTETTDPTRNTLEETARREVLEEVGLTLVDPIVYVESHTFAIGTTPVLDIVMLARADSGEPYPAAPDEVADALWLTFDELLADPRTQVWTRNSLVLAERKRLELGW